MNEIKKRWARFLAIIPAALVMIFAMSSCANGTFEDQGTLRLYSPLGTGEFSGRGESVVCVPEGDEFLCEPTPGGVQYVVTVRENTR